jgi:hypothetical protein
MESLVATALDVHHEQSTLSNHRLHFLNFPTVQSLRLYLELAMLNFPEYFLFFVEIFT